MDKNELSNKTLQELEGEDWGEPTYNTQLVIRCHRLRRVRLKDFTVEDLRMMIGQEISLPYLLPIALGVLRETPFAEGNMYPGDLLSSVLRLPGQFWDSHPALKQELDEVVEQAVAEIDLPVCNAPDIPVELKQQLRQYFLRRNSNL